MAPVVHRVLALALAVAGGAATACNGEVRAADTSESGGRTADAGDSGGPKGLRDGEITADAGNQCEIPFPHPENGEFVDPNRVVVAFTPFSTGISGEIPQLSVPSDCEASPDHIGWIYDDTQSPMKILLCAGSCERTGTGVVTARYGCPPPQIGPTM